MNPPSTGEALAAPPRTATGQRRKQATRERLLDAAAELFVLRGYNAVPIEDIASSAGVSRMTFYRHFSDKVQLSIALFNREAARAMPRLLRIAGEKFHDRGTVRRWIADLFEADRQERSLLRVFNQVTAEGAGFTGEAQGMIHAIIAGLAQGIPAFELRQDRKRDRRRWLEAWLLIYEILDQSNHAALDSGIAGDPLVVDILADRFLAFVDGSAR